MNKGKLYIVATPIGNLGDITYRAIDTLKKVPFILAEDTRETKKLLNKYEIKTQLVSYRDQNHERMLEKIYEKLNMGFDLALVSDSGTPLVSDPGFKLVRDLREKGYEIIPIPGPSALISALSVSGIPTDKFTYLGFLPKSDIKRKKILNEYIDMETSLVFYESPNRLLRLFYVLRDVFGKKKIFVARDMTKLREGFDYGNISDIISKYEKDMFDVDPHGEYVVILQTK